MDNRKKGDLEVKGLRKIINYEIKLMDYNRWKRKADKEEVEYQVWSSSSSSLKLTLMTSSSSSFQ